MHIHNWGRWEDVKVDEKGDMAVHAGIVVIRKVLTQQRRCSVCNLVKTRYSA
jgi:hypothetical protein